MKFRETAELELRLALDQAPVMLWCAAPDGQLLFANQAWLAFRGRRLDEESGWGWLEGVFENDRAGVIEAVELACATKRAFEIAYRLRRADGTWRWMALNATPRSKTRGVPGFIGSCVDVTDLRHNGSGANSPLNQLETLIGNARDMAYRMRITPDRAIEYAVGAVEAITGYKAEDFYADPTLLARAIHPDDTEVALERLQSHEGFSTPEFVLRWLHPDGRVVHAEHRPRPIVDASGRVVAIEGLAHDITGLIESQERLRESEEQMRQLAARLQQAREEERTRLARELHDELGQTMTALKLEIGRAMAALNPSQLTPTVVDRMQSLMGLSEIVLSTVKRIATDLRPPALDHLGLAEAIRFEALAFKARSGLRCHVRATASATRLTLDQQTAIFRIFQEALTNVARHAGASAVTVTITERRHFELRIQDNGKGIAAASAADPRSIGLIGMRERAALVGGTFHIAGRRGKGTTVCVHVPLPALRTAKSPARHARPRRASQSHQ